MSNETVDLEDAVVRESTSTNEETPEEVPAETPEKPEGKTFTQDDVNSLLAKQKRELREQFQNHKDPEAFEEATRTLTERAENAERELAEVKHQMLKTRISAETGVPENLLVGDTEETMRQTAQMLSEWRGGASKSDSTSRKVNQSGAAKSPEVLSPREQAAAALRAMRGGN